MSLVGESFDACVPPRSILALWIGFCLPMVLSGAWADDVDVMAERARQELFDLGVQLGDERLIIEAGGHVAGGRAFRPGEDAMATLEAELKADLERLNGGENRYPPWLYGSRPGQSANGTYEPQRASFFEAKRRAAIDEMDALVKSADLPRQVDAAGIKTDVGVENDYLPSISGLLIGSGVAQSAATPPDSTPGNSAFLPLEVWSQASNDVGQRNPQVYGFISAAEFSVFRFVDEQGREVSVRDRLAFLGEDRAPGITGLRGSEDSPITVQLSNKLVAGFQEAQDRFSEALQTARLQRHRVGGLGGNPTAAYRWIFGQLLDGKAASYVPFKLVCPSPPRMMLALVGVARRDGDMRVIEAERLLVTVTPLPSHARFVFGNKGTPAVLVGREGVHDTAFIRCPLFCNHKEKWFRDRPALRRVSMEPDTYLRSMLVAPFDELDKMNRQLVDEIRSASSEAMEEAYAEAAVTRGLKAASLDRRNLKSSVRLFTNGLGRRIADQLVAIGAGEAVPVQAIRNLADDRARFSKLIKDPQVTLFINKELTESFLILSVDHEGVSLCDFSTLLGVHLKYLPICMHGNGDDGLTRACRFAEIRSWLRIANSNARVPMNPPFRVLPTTNEGKRIWLDEQSSAEVNNDDHPDATEVRNKDEAENATTGDFNFPDK